MNCKILCGKSVSGVVGKNIITFLPDLNDISFFKSKIEAVVLADENILSHSYIFFKLTGVTVVCGVDGLKRGDKVKIDVASSTLNITGRSMRISTPGLFSSIVSIPFPYSGYSIGLWRTEGMLLDGIRDFRKDYRMFSLLEPDGVIRLFDFCGDKESLARGMAERLREKQLFDISCLKTANILVPNVHAASDIRYVRCRLDSMCGSPRDFKIGAMIEDSAGICALSEIINEADFISIGFNGFLRELLDEQRALSAAVRIVHGARKAGKHCTVCGESITKPYIFNTLTLCGINGFCLAPEDIPFAEDLLSLERVSDQLCFL